MKKIHKIISSFILLALIILQQFVLISCNHVENSSKFEYTVERYFENLYGNYVIDADEIETFEALENEEVTAEIKKYEHFIKTEHKDQVLTGKVKSDNSLVLKVYYMRERLSITFVVEGEVFQSEELPYGTTTSAPMTNIENVPSENGVEKVFKYWSESENGPEYDFDKSTYSNLTLYAVFEKVIKTYGLSVTLDNELYTLVKPSGEAWILDGSLNYTAIAYGTEFKFKVSTKDEVIGEPLVNLTKYNENDSVTEALLPDSNGVYTVLVQENIKVEITGLTKMKTLEFDDTSIGYYGAWGVFEDSWYYGNRAHSSYTKDDYALISVYDASAIRISGDKSFDRGRFDVYLDGEFIETVDTYSETRTASQTLFELIDLSSGAHTIRIVNTGLTSGSGIWVVIDKISVAYNDSENIQGVNEKFESIKEENEVYTTYDDCSYGYVGSWGLYPGNFSGGLAHGSNTQGDYALIQVKDVTAVRIYCEKSVDRGDVDIYIDGTYVETVSGYASVLQSNQVLWEKEDLTEGYHTIRVVNKATPVPWLVLDKIEVKYKESKDYVAYDDASLGFEGTWGPYYDVNYLGNYAHGSETKDASYTFHVSNAKNIKIYGNKAPDRAKANVYVDGVLVQTINTYAPNVTAVDVICLIENLPEGDHTVTIANTGETDGYGTWLVIDDISINYYDSENIKGVNESVINNTNNYTDFDDCMYGFVGEWQCYPGNYSGGYVNASYTAGDYFIWSFTDVKNIVLYGPKGPDRAKAAIYLDGVYVGTMDTYNDTYTDVVALFELKDIEKGTHTIRVVNTGETSGTGIWLLVDKVSVTYYDENKIVGPEEMINDEKKQIIREIDDCSVGYYGDWRYYSLVGNAYYNGTCYATSTVGDYAVFTVIDAKTVEIYGTKNPDRSKVDVFLNGKYYQTIDNYASSFQSSLLLKIDNLPFGVNTIKLVNTCKRSGDGTWFVIDRYVTTYYEEQKEAIITASNNSFFTGNNAILHEEEEYFDITDGTSVSVTVKGSKISLYANKELSNGSKAKIIIDENKTIYVTISEDGLIYTIIDPLENYHTIEVFYSAGTVTLSYLTTDDFSTTPIQLEMFEKAQENISKTLDGTKIVSDPNDWESVENKIFAPKSGVTLTDGMLKELFDKNVLYLNDAMQLKDYVDSPQAFWVDTLPASNEGRLLQGLANSLIWGEHNENYRKELDKLINTIRQRQMLQNGNALPYDEHFLGTTYDTDQGYGERKNYDRAMLTRGLIAAANYYEYIGYSDESNPSYIILREFYDWFNYNENGYGLSMIGGQLGYQGHIASTLTYFSNVGKTEDLTYAELCYVQDWWLEYLTNGTLEAIWKYPLDRTNCYMITGIEPYLDHYRATGNEKYLNACLKFWEIYKENFIHDNGVMAFCEHRNYEPNSFYLSNAKHTGELCGTVFWIDFNYKLLQLFPEEEKFAHEIERGILNVLPASQDENGKVIYHQSSNGYLQSSGRVNACCEVTSVGLKARIASFIYQLSQDGVYVTLYNDSVLNTNYNGKNYHLKTTGDVFSTDLYKIENLGDDMILSLRIPSWVAEDYFVKVNEEYVNVKGVGQYHKISIKKGDSISVYLPKKVEIVKYYGFDQVPGYERYTIMNGPLSVAICPSGSFTSVVCDKESILKTNYTIEDFSKTISFKINKAGINNEFDLVPYAKLGYKYFALYPLYNTSDTNKENIVKLPNKGTNTNYIVFDQSFDYYGTFINNSNELISYDGIEEKAISKDISFEEGSVVSIKISSNYAYGKIDGGLYLGVKGNVSSQLDAITAYNVNVEKAAGASYYEVKIHAFDYNEGKGQYLGCLAQVRIEGVVSSVELSVLYKNGKIYIYVNSNIPCIEMEIGKLDGQIGVRSFMTSQKFYDMIIWEE